MKAVTLIALGLAIAAMGIYLANADDAPGAAVMGMLPMVVGVVLGLEGCAQLELPIWAARTALAVGVVVAAFAAFLTHGVVVTAPSSRSRRRCHRSSTRRRRRNMRRPSSARGSSCAQPYWSKACPGCPWRSVPAAPSSGPKGLDGGTS